MRHVCCAILLFVFSAPVAVAQTLDKAKLRQAIELPAISTQFNVEFKSNERDSRGNKLDPQRQIDELKKKLTGGLDDAEVYLEQRAVYLECVKDKETDKLGQELIAKAE